MFENMFESYLKVSKGLFRLVSPSLRASCNMWQYFALRLQYVLIVEIWKRNCNCSFNDLIRQKYRNTAEINFEILCKCRIFIWQPCFQALPLVCDITRTCFRWTQGLRSWQGPSESSESIRVHQGGQMGRILSDFGFWFGRSNFTIFYHQIEWHSIQNWRRNHKDMRSHRHTSPSRAD